MDAGRHEDPCRATDDEWQTAGAGDGRVGSAGGVGAGIPHGSISPSVSRPGKGNAYRLAFVSGQQDVGLRLVNLLAPRLGGTITAHSPFCDASRFDTPGRFSPDSRQVAFASDRSGSQQIWIATWMDWGCGA